MAQSYARDMGAAARRHLEAGEYLLERNPPRGDVAGYLFGLAAECALKQMMLAANMRRLPDADRKNDPFFAHFQELKTLLLDRASGRLASRLNGYASDSRFMQYWDIRMRYSDGKGIKVEWIKRWHGSARDVVGAMDS